jgi:hypothetical protein
LADLVQYLLRRTRPIWMTILSRFELTHSRSFRICPFIRLIPSS